MFKTFKNIKQITGGQAKKLIIPIVLTILDTFISMFTFGAMILTLGDLLANNFTFSKLLLYSSICLIVFIVRCVTFSTGYIQAQYRGSSIATGLRLSLGDYVRSLNLGYFNTNSIGKLTASLTTDISDFETVITHSLVGTFNAIFFTIFALFFAFLMDYRFASILILVICIALPFLSIAGRRANKNAHYLKAAINNVVSRVVEYMGGIKTFKLYNLTGEKFERMEQSFAKLRKESIRMELSVIPYAMGFNTITSWIIPIALLLGTYFLSNGDISKQTFLSLIMISISISNVFTTLGSLYPQLKALDKASQNILDILHEQPLPYVHDQIAFRNYDIAFHRVNFHYTEKVEVIKEINFCAKEGTTTALIGPSGSGKSTIISLISRFWDIQKGEISIGDENIKMIKPDFITEKIAVVFQNVYLLNDTFFQNIKMGNPNASDGQVYEAAKAANCHDFIMAKEGGYEGMIGEGGSTLSGGEKQRISIARAFIKDAPIILLDESTSSLDADNELEIGRSLDKLMKDKTSIVIAHRLNTIVHANNIIVLEEGEVKEQGNHQELLAHDGWYKRMYEEQHKAKGWQI